MKTPPQIATFLGKGADFEGHLKFTGAIRIDGLLRGEIDAPEGDLVVGQEARIDADIRVHSVLISGEINGNIVASDRIELMVPARINGDIEAPTIKVQEGVTFAGSCRTRPSDDGPKGKLALLSES
jgi:cytoskeletal protein CcmA (bactofilin family)